MRNWHRSQIQKVVFYIHGTFSYPRCSFDLQLNVKIFLFQSHHQHKQLQDLMVFSCVPEPLKITTKNLTLHAEETSHNFNSLDELYQRLLYDQHIQTGFREI